MGKERPTKHLLKLKNGSIIRCLPTGASGVGIRGFTIDRLIADESAYIEEAVFDAVTPMLLTTGGDIVLVSTPKGKMGYFWKCYKDPSFKVFHINSEEGIKNREISVSWTEQQRAKALEHLEREKMSMTNKAYSQEYLGQFVDDLRQWFPDELIRSCMTLKRRDSLRPDRVLFMGCDIARMGEDLTVCSIVDRTNRENLEQVESVSTSKTRINETVQQIKDLDKIYKFKKIYIDTGGIGAGVYDYLFADPQTTKKVVDIDNSKRSVERDDKRKVTLMKEDLYSNLLMLMEQGKIKLLDDDEIFLSLKSVQYEYVIKPGEETKLKIFGTWTHHAESLVRACWCTKDKSLNIWCAY
jgi:hypothetical protein